MLKLTKKSPRDFVTAADIAVEAFLKETLTTKYRNMVFGGKRAVKALTKPIDG